MIVRVWINVCNVWVFPDPTGVCLAGRGWPHVLQVSSANKHFNSLRDENDEPIYSLTDTIIRSIVGHRKKWGRCDAFNQHYKSEVSDEAFNIISKEINVNGNINEILEQCFKYEKQYAKVFESKYIENRDIDQREKLIEWTRNLTCYQIIKQLSKLDSNKTQMDYDATSTSLYPSAMWDEKSVYAKIETGFAFKPDMNDVYVEAFNNQTFN